MVLEWNLVGRDWVGSMRIFYRFGVLGAMKSGPNFWNPDQRSCPGATIRGPVLAGTPIKLIQLLDPIGPKNHVSRMGARVPVTSNKQVFSGGNYDS